jgi:acetyl-CoA carboxylase biotin carboxylase subunit
VFYDSMICKLIVHGPDRDAARRGMLDALGRFRVEGIKTTIPVHQQILADPGFAAGEYDTGFIARLLG